MKIGDKIFTEELEGDSIILSIDGDTIRVENEYEGFKRVNINEIINFESSTKKEETTTLKIYTFTGVVNGIKGSKQSRGTMFGFNDIYSKIEEMDFNIKTGESGVAGQIIENARNGKFISEKQSQLVAYFSKNNGLLK